jgi:fibronectin type 3 domain-containing protein
VPATSGSPGYISLSWDIGTENNIAGYFVYRSEQAQTRGERLNQELLPTPTYRDTSAVSGKRYFYRVTAADEANDESEPGPPVEAQLGVQP